MNYKSDICNVRFSLGGIIYQKPLAQTSTNHVCAFELLQMLVTSFGLLPGEETAEKNVGNCPRKTIS